MNKKILISIFILFFICISNVFANHPDNKQTIFVGVFDYQPLVFMNEDNVPDGFFIELLKEIAKEENWNLVYEYNSWDGNLQKIRNISIDLFMGAAYTKERAKYMDFSKESIFSSWAQLYTNTESNIKTVFDVKDKKIGLMTNDINGKFFLELINSIKIECEIIYLDETKDLFQLLKKNEVNGIVVNNITGSLYASKDLAIKNTNVILNPFLVYYVVPKGENSYILEAIDKHLNEWKSHDDSIYYQLLDQWLHRGSNFKPYIPNYLKLTILIISVFLILSIISIVMFKSLLKIKTKDLLENQSFLNETNKLAKVGGFILYLDGYTVWTKELYKMYEIPLTEEIYFNKICEEFHSDVKDELEKFMIELKSKKNKTTILLKFKTRNTKTEKWGRVVATPVLNKHGNLIKITGASQEITELIKAQEEKDLMNKQLLQSRKMESIGTLSSGIAHDFNNILFIIQGNIQLLLNDCNESQKEKFNIINKASERAVKLIKQIVSYSKHSDEELSNINIKYLIKDTINLSRSSIPKNIKITTNIENADFIIKGEETKIGQVILNLITNAFHAVENKNGIIEISLKNVNISNGDLIKKNLPKGNYVQLTITDNGYGISPENLDRIFDPYFTTKEKGKGTGLGLAIVYGIIKESDGFINVYSELNKGTTINIYIPSVKEESEEINDVVCYEKEDLKGKETIMIVDDEQPLTELIQRYFAKYGYKTKSFIDPIKALEEFKKYSKQYDLVITDMAMPNMTGDELVVELLKIKPNLPIILCSGFSEKMNKTDIKKLGVKKYFIKPVDLTKLLTHVKGILNDRHYDDRC